MNKDEFNDLLKQAELTRAEFAKILNTSHQTINNWGSNGRNFPYWVKSWLENYIGYKKYKIIQKTLAEG